MAATGRGRGQGHGQGHGQGRAVLHVSRRGLAFWQVALVCLFLLQSLFFLARSPFVNIGVYRKHPHGQAQAGGSNATSALGVATSAADVAVDRKWKEELEKIDSDVGATLAGTQAALRLTAGTRQGLGLGQGAGSDPRTIEARKKAGTYIELDPARKRALLRQIGQQDATLKFQEAAKKALEENHKSFMLDLKVKQHEMVDAARDGKRQARLAQLGKLRKAIAQQGGQADASQKEELRFLEDWEASDRLFTPGWKAEGEKLKKELAEVRKGEGRTLYTEGRESKRRLMEASQAATAMGVFNKQSPKHQDRFPLNASRDARLPLRIPIVLLVRNNTQALLLCLQALSRVQGIAETLLIVSHDGLFQEPNNMVLRNATFSQLKQLFNPFSPHLHPQSFPGASPKDCSAEGPSVFGCVGQKDRTGRYRSPALVSPKLHWWWTMSTVWDELAETKGHSGPILFIHEDTLVHPHGYRQIQELTRVQGARCPSCLASQLLSPSASEGESPPHFLVEPLASVAYAFNRSAWEQLKKHAEEFCLFDDHRWHASVLAAVAPKTGPWKALSWTYPGAHSLAGCIPGAPGAASRGLSLSLPPNCSFLERPGDLTPRRALVQGDAAVAVPEPPKEVAPGAPMGGFGDARDHGLCLSLGDSGT